MKVTIEHATEDPVDVCSKAAGTCYAKRTKSVDRLARCFALGHHSVFEHAAATFYVEGISRACMAQLTRHRVASFCVESQRYCKYDLAGRDWYVKPEAFSGANVNAAAFDKIMEVCGAAYNAALKHGIRPEDARFLLPEASKTNITVTMNCRELFHFFDMRRDKAAQWEIRQLAEAMAEALKAQSWEWEFLIHLWEHKNGGGKD